MELPVPSQKQRSPALFDRVHCELTRSTFLSQQNVRLPFESFYLNAADNVAVCLLITSPPNKGVFTRQQAGDHWHGFTFEMFETKQLPRLQVTAQLFLPRASCTAAMCIQPARNAIRRLHNAKKKKLNEPAEITRAQRGTSQSLLL